MTAPTLQELMTRLEEQQARIDRLEAGSESPALPSSRESTESDPHPTRMTRRGMLMSAAVGTAGVVGAMLVEPQAADAAADAAKGPTSFASKSSKAAIKAKNTGSGDALSASSKHGTTIAGNQTSTKTEAIAVKGAITGPNGTGTGVAGSAAKGTGVKGTSTSGTGVKGTSTSGTGVGGAATSGTGVTGKSNTGVGVAGASSSTADDAAAVHGSITSTSPGGDSAGVLGTNAGTGGLGIGVYGSQNGSGYGVYGTTPSGYGIVGESSDGTGVSGSTETGSYGVLGSAPSGSGVYGSASSGTGSYGASQTGTGVRGTSSSGYGVYGSSSSNYGLAGTTTSGNGVYGQVSADTQAGVVGRQLDASGNWALYGFGNIGATGTKSAVVPAADGNGHLTLYCMESPECWFEDFGSAKLSGGSASVKIDPEFAQTVDTGGYHVFTQPEGECKGLSVPAMTPTGFSVRELNGGTSNVAFSYRIVARRKDVTAPRLNRITLPEARTTSTD